MADEETVKPGKQVEQAKQEAQQEIKQANDLGETAKKLLAEKYLNELAAKAGAAKEVRDLATYSRGMDITPKRAEAIEVKTTLVKVLEAVKAGIIQPQPKTKVVLDRLAERSEGFTDTSASYLQPILEKYINKDISFSKKGEELTEFEKDFRQLKTDNPNAAQLLGQVLKDEVGHLGDISQEDLEKQLELKIDDEGKVKVEDKGADDADGSRQDEDPRDRARRFRQGEIPFEEMTPEEKEIYMDSYVERVRHEVFELYLTEEDNEFLKRILFPEEFIKHVKGERDKLMNNPDPHHHYNEHQALEHVSEELEKELIGIVDKILTRFSETNPENFFEQVASENFLKGIQTTLATLGSYLDRFRKGLEDYEIKNPDSHLHLYRAVGLEPIKEDTIIKGKTEKPRFRFKPLSTPDAVSLSGFASYMRLLMDEYKSEREYLHNSRAILMHPKEGDHGFYENLAHYAEKMKTPAIDEMFLLPNSDLLQDALTLYDKFVEEQFASQDWKHTTDMFLNRTGMVTTRLEQEVLAALKKMHPEVKAESTLKSALFMAVGAARGIFMNEEEKAAFADPNLNPDGSPTYASYYTNDADPLVPLNPAHFFMRWQAERSLPLWLFLPVEGYNPHAGTRHKGRWDHKDLWDKMQKYKDSFLEGRDKMLDEPTLMDFLVDVGNVGGPGKRKGWRVQYSAEGHFVYKEQDGKSTDKIDVLKSWQAVENIGYEVAFEFLFKGFGVPGGIRSDRYAASAEKQEFFKYLYKNYFLQDQSKFNEGELTSFLDGLTGDAKKLADLRLNTGMIKRTDYEAEIETQKSNLFFAETMARLVAKRFPSKVLRVDRDRFNESGVGRWNKIRQEMKMSSVDFDKVMKNYGLAEAILRRETSFKMKTNLKKYVEEHNEAHPDSPISIGDKNIGFHIDETRKNIDFRLTEDYIRKVLSQEDREISEKEVSDVITLHKLLQENYIGENDTSRKFLSTFAKYISPTITEEGGYTFTFGLDDTDMSLLAFRGAGGRVLPRVLKDTAAVEKGVVGEITTLNDKLHAAAINGKQDFSELVASLKKIRDTLVDVHGPDYGQKVAHHMALAVINFFKKDTLARSVFTSWTVAGENNSLAAEIYGGPTANIWEWDVATIDQFIYSLRTARVIPQKGFDPSMGLPYEYKDMEVNLFGKKISLGKFKIPRKKDSVWDEAALRRDAGAEGKHIAWEMLNNVLPILIAFVLWKWIQEAFKESDSKK